MRDLSERGHEVESLRCLIALLTAETQLIRLRRSLTHKYSPNQPRAPAGQTDGGRWVSDGSGGGGLIDRLPRGQGRWASLAGDGEPGTTTTERTVTEDGGRVLSIRIRAGRGEWDEQHAVVTPDGESRIFETSGTTQTIRDGETGEVLARSTFTSRGAEPEARVQPALFRILAPAATAAARTIEAAASLFAVLSARNTRNATAILGLTATEFSPNGDPGFSTTWVGRLNREDLDAACPRAGEVKAIADEAAAKVKSQIEGLSPQEFGNRVHMIIKNEVNSRRDPKFVAETSLSRTGDPTPSYGDINTYRLDVLEQTDSATVCVYDHKTGISGLSARRASELASVVGRRYPGTRRIIVIQVRLGR